MADPFSDTVAAIWTTLEASSDFAARVPAGNRLKLTGQVEGQMDDTPRDAFKPAIRIVPSDGEFDQAVDSSDSALEQSWDIEIFDSDDRCSSSFYPLMWSVLRALSAAFPASSTIRSLTFNSKKYNRACHLTRSRQDWDTRGDGTSTIKRWRCLWKFTVLMHFATADLPPSA